MVLGAKKGKIWPRGQIDPKGTHPPPKHVFGCTERKSLLLRVSCGRIEGTKKKLKKWSHRGQRWFVVPYCIGLMPVRNRWVPPATRRAYTSMRLHESGRCRGYCCLSSIFDFRLPLLASHVATACVHIAYWNKTITSAVDIVYIF